MHEEMQAQDGTFRGNPIHNYVNHPIAARVLVKMLTEAPILGTVRGSWSMDSCGAKILTDAFRQLNDLSAQHSRRSLDRIGFEIGWICG
ncbi:MAG TPA: hypothetical protein VE093_36085 [Polyangiaceae bacterium]|nr:hypothetical protein [Polyangiaceae bacterium]